MEGALTVNDTPRVSVFDAPRLMVLDSDAAEHFNL